MCNTALYSMFSCNYPITHITHSGMVGLNSLLWKLMLVPLYHMGLGTKLGADAFQYKPIPLFHLSLWCFTAVKLLIRREIARNFI